MIMRPSDRLDGARVSSTQPLGQMIVRRVPVGVDGAT